MAVAKTKPAATPARPGAENGAGAAVVDIYKEQEIHALGDM